jgi:hypothetical protein
MSAGVLGAVLAAFLAVGPDAPADQERSAGPGPLHGTLVAAAPGAREELFASVGPSHAVQPDVIVQALPPAPEIVIRQTSYYGTVTIDHRAHLARRISCKACHGPGAVRKIEFTPRIAHERCVGCHRVEARGPRDCKGCHVKPVEPPPTVTAKAEEKPAAEKAPAPVPSAVAALVAAAPPPPQPLHTFRRTVEVGYAAGTALGPALRLSGRQDRVALEHSIERLTASGDTRTIALVGGGYVHPIRNGVELVAVALGGIDAVERPETGVMPALGARVGLSWLHRRLWLADSVNLSVTGVVDVANRRALRQDIGGTTVYASLGMGFRLNRR